MIEVKNLKKTYKPKKGAAVQALKGINLKFEEKGLVFILGKSGSGKSTLLNMLGGLDKFDDGEIIIKGKSSKQFTQSDFDSYRNTFIGFIFQEYNILNDFTVGANIALAMELQGRKPTKEELNKILDEVDLTGFASRKPNELSGGQKQRVAIARALIKNPEIIMADEPTGALDSNTGKQVFDTLKKLSKDKLVIVVSHDRDFAEQYGDRVIELADGEIISDIKKYISKPNEVSSGISIIEDKIIHIKSGYELTNKDLEMINEYLKNNKDADSFISVDGKTNKEIKKAVRIDDDGNREGFEETSDKNLWVEEYDASKFKLIRSKLPLKNSLKMAFGSLKKKPIRLLVTIFLSMVAFTLFGLSNTMSSYDKIKAGTDSIIDSNVNYASFGFERKIKNSEYSYYVKDKLSDEDVENIKNHFKDYSFNEIVKPNDSYIPIQNIYDTDKVNINGEFSFYSSEFYGISKISQDMIDRMGYTLEGALPVNDDEVVITDYMAQSFIIGKYKMNYGPDNSTDIKKTTDMIGKVLELDINGNKKYTVTGILDTKFESSRYDKYKEEIKGNTGILDYTMMSELSNIRTYSNHAILFTSDNVFNSVVKNNIGVQIFSQDYYISFINNTNEYDYYEIDRICEIGKINDVVKNNIVMINNQAKLNDNEMILPLSALETYINLDYEEGNIESIKKSILANANEISKLPMIMQISNEGSDWVNNDKNMRVVGIYIDNELNKGMAILPNGICNAFSIYSKGKYDALITTMPDKRSEIEKLVKYSFNNGISDVKYTLQNNTTELLSTATEVFTTLKKVFLYVGIFFAIFASIMLMNFIATSILQKKREIGILRAVGARGADVFMIFFNESIIIAIINWIVSAIATGTLISIINKSFRKEYHLVITLLHFGIIQIVLMLVLCLIVAFVASFIPVYKESRKKPIEAIRKG